MQVAGRVAAVYPAPDMVTPLPARPMDAWFATISKQERLSGPFPRSVKGRGGTDACRCREPDGGCAARVSPA